MKKDNEGDDVFGILNNAISCKQEVVILKSKSRKLCMERDGMDHEEFEEHWSYNIEGSKGEISYSVVDDEIGLEELQELLVSDEEIRDPHRKKKKKS